MIEILMAQVRDLRKTLEDVEERLPHLLARQVDESRLSVTLARASQAVGAAWGRLTDHAQEDS